ncbi:MAG: hypothetical protein N2376_12130 [Clostridia bacterium]|nr:hypothetical protein [Clostridia bacterium]
MSYQEKKTIVSIVTGLFVLIAYCVFAFGKYQSGVLDLADFKPWAITMLIFIAIGIAVTIVIQIIFHILISISFAVQETVKNGKCDDKAIERTIGAEMVTDEMSKLIELKSMRFGFVASGIGFVAALISVALSFPPAVMLNIMFVSFMAGSLLEGFAQLFFYRRGINNG